MMDRLIAIADRLRVELSEFLAFTLPPGTVQGAALDVDRYWLSSWRAAWGGRVPRSGFPLDDAIWWGQDSLLKEVDFSYRPPHWKRHCEVLGYPRSTGPLVVRVALNKTLPSGQEETIDAEQLPSTFNSYPLRYEVRPRAVAVSVMDAVRKRLRAQWGRGSEAVSSIGRRNPYTRGTLAGFLACSALNRRYAMSCAHVLGATGVPVYRQAGGQPISDGVVTASFIPAPRAANAVCNLTAAPDALRVDVAIAEWQGGAAADLAFPRPLNRALRGTSAISPYARVGFAGTASGQVSACIGPPTIWQEIDFEDFDSSGPSTRCFGSLFELTDGLGDTRGVAEPGDSGSLVYDETDGSWIGMVVAQHGRRAYGCYAEFVMSVLNGQGSFPGGLTWNW
jgi:hypothetical protein